jgi:hypothetical protein
MWVRILKHTGADLDERVSNNEWCKKNEIKDGVQYLWAWLSLALRGERVPILNLHGPQMCGASTFTLLASKILSRDPVQLPDSLFNSELKSNSLVIIGWRPQLVNRHTNHSNVYLGSTFIRHEMACDKEKLENKLIYISEQTSSLIGFDSDAVGVQLGLIAEPILRPEITKVLDNEIADLRQALAFQEYIPYEGKYGIPVL